MYADIKVYRDDGTLLWHQLMPHIERSDGAAYFEQPLVENQREVSAIELVVTARDADRP